MRSTNTETIVKSIAREYGYTEREIYDIVKAPFNFVAQIMKGADRENLEFPSIRIKYFATFYCSDERKKYFRKFKEKKDARRAAREAAGYGTRVTINKIFTGDGRPDNDGEETRGDGL